MAVHNMNIVFEPCPFIFVIIHKCNIFHTFAHSQIIFSGFSNVLHFFLADSAKNIYIISDHAVVRDGTLSYINVASEFSDLQPDFIESNMKSITYLWWLVI